MPEQSEYEKLRFAQEILSTAKTCSNCYHHRDGRCEVYSCNCVTSVRKVSTPFWWLSYEEGEARKR